MVKPGLFGSVMLNAIQVFLPIVHVVLKGPVAVVTVISLPHGAGYLLKPARCHLLNRWKTVNKKQKRIYTSALSVHGE